MIERMTGIVLHQVRYNDDSLIVDVYTRRMGNVSFLVKTPKKRKGNIRALLLRPLNILELDFDYRPSLHLQRIKDMRLAVSYETLLFDPMKETLAFFLSEFLYHALRQESHNEELFDYLQQSLQWLDQSGRNIANFHIVCLIRLTRFLGIWPNVSNYQQGNVFDLEEGVMTDTLPAHELYLDVAESALVPLLLRLDYGTMRLLRLNRVQRGRILDVILLYYKTHVPGFPVLKSLDVLKEILNPAP